MNLTAIACIGKNYELGANNDLIWRFREDLQTFKKITSGHTIVMGRKTFESLPGLLPNRRHLVITRGAGIDNIETFKSISEFIEFAKNHDGEVFVIGGGEIYTQLMPYCKKMILTHVDAVDLSAEIFFPKFDKSKWIVESSESFIDSVTGIHYARKIYINPD